VLKKVLIEWSEGLELNVARMVAARKKEYLNAPSDDAFCKNITKDLK